jgi:ferredoxin-NADP reductase
MLSGGIGITPLRSIIKYINDKMIDTDIVLLYSNRHEDDIAFEQEFDEIMAKNQKFNIINTITNPGSSWTGLTGRISADMIKKHVPNYLNRVFYISGPTKMVDSMVALLKELSLPEEKIKKELFTGYE